MVRAGNSNLKTLSCDKLWHFVSLNSTQAFRALMDDVVTIQWKMHALFMINLFVKNEVIPCIVNVDELEECWI